MKRILFLILLLLAIIMTASCGFAGVGNTEGSLSSNTSNASNSLSEIQDFVREAQTAFESNDLVGTQEGVSGLIEISNNPLYSESERLIAQFCATYINSGVMLDYIIKNDNQWLETHDISEFDAFYSFVFTEVVNGQITKIDTLKSYMLGLIGATQGIYARYNELIAK